MIVKLLLARLVTLVVAVDLNIDHLVKSSKAKRLAHLEEQAMEALQFAVESGGNVNDNLFFQ